LAELNKVGTDPRNMQMMPADGYAHIFGKKEDVFNYDIIEFVDGEIHTIDLPWELIKKGKKVVCRIWTKPEYKKVYDTYADNISYLFSWNMPAPLVQPHSYTVIPNAVETDFFGFRQPNPNPKPLKIGYLGILVYWKGHQFIERIVADLVDNKKADVELHMFGREDEKPIDHPAIKYHGLITDRNEVPKAFQSFDIYSLPWNPKTEPDAYWVVGGESISCGLPVVSFNCGSAREFIDSGKNGYMANSLEDMANKLMIYTDPKTLQEHSYHSRVKALHKFHPEVISAQMAKFLHSIK